MSTEGPQAHNLSYTGRWTDINQQKINQYATQLSLPRPLPPCTLSVRNPPGKVSLCWDDVNSTHQIKNGRILVAVVGSMARLVLPKSFPPAKTGSLVFEGLFTPVSDYCTIHVTSEVTLEEAKVPKLPPYVASYAASMSSRIPNNVAICFPRTRRTIWANETVLLQSVPYLTPHLESGFSEGIATRSTTSSSSVQFDPCTFEDSDEEADAETNEEGRTGSVDETAASFKKIEIVDTSYTTYFSVLCWIATGYIEFARLKSSNRFGVSLDMLYNECPRGTSPCAASPKSIYRLSHLLELPHLSELALENFKSQLTVDNVAYELYTDAANVYPALRDVALAFAVKNWKEVVKTKAYAEVEQRMQQAGGGGIDLRTTMLLMKGLIKCK